MQPITADKVGGVADGSERPRETPINQTNHTDNTSSHPPPPPPAHAQINSTRAAPPFSRGDVANLSTVQRVYPPLEKAAEADKGWRDGGIYGVMQP